MKRFYIYAGTAEQAKNLARDMLLEPNEWSYVLNVEKLMGVEKKPLLMCGTWRDREDIANLEYVANARQMKFFYINRGVKL